MLDQLLKKVCICLLAIILISCSTPNLTNINTNIIKPLPKQDLDQKSPQSIVPQWFTQSPNNNNEYLYGNGSDNSYKKATEKALMDMVQRLQVIVSTNTSLKTVSLNNEISQKLVQEISTQTANINILNYKIINQSESNGTFYIELQINIKDTIRLLQQTISNQTTESLALIKASQNKSFLDRFDTTQKLNKKLRIIKSSLRTLIILAPDTDIENQMIQLNNLENKTLNLKRNIVIKITRNNSGYFYDSLKKYLELNKFSLSSFNPNIELSLKLLDYNHTTMNRNYCIKTDVELQASDTTSNQLAPKIYIMKACSNKGRLFAIEKTSKAFYLQLNSSESIL